MVDSKNEDVKLHEYLLKEEYYESRQVGTRAKSDKVCEHCGKKIPKGTPHDMHHFYPEFYSYPVHKECEKGFLASLRDARNPDY